MTGKIGKEQMETTTPTGIPMVLAEADQLVQAPTMAIQEIPAMAGQIGVTLLVIKAAKAVEIL